MAISSSGGGLFGGGFSDSPTLLHCTISGNEANRGAGIFNDNRSLTLRHCTLTGNTAATEGGGLQGASSILTHNVIAGNTAPTGPDVRALEPMASIGRNLIGKTEGSSGWIASDLTGTSAAPLDPLLGPLQNNGGPTPTHALLPGSPAIDAGGLSQAQRIFVSSAASPFTLTFQGQTTAPLDRGDSAATVQTALEALYTIGAGNVLVNRLFIGEFYVIFHGTLGGAGQPAITATGPGSTHPLVTTLQEGGAAPGFDQRGSGFARVTKGKAESAGPRIDIGAYEAAQVVAEIAVFNGTSTASGDERVDNTGVAAFGDQALNSTSAARTFTIQNTGTDALALGTVALAGDDAGQFRVTQPASTLLMPLATTTFTVAFTPTSLGGKAARVEIPSNDAGVNPFRIPLSGTGVAGGPPAEPVDVAVSGSFMLPAQGLAGGGRLYRPLTGVINDAGRVALRVMGQTGTGGITSSSDSLLLSDVSGSLRVVAREGAVVRVSPWQTLTGSFAGLLVTDAGQVVFQDKIRGASAATDMGYFSSPDGLALELASREGDAAPGGGTFMTHTGSPAADAQGRVYFCGQVRGRPLTQDTGVWMRHGGTLTRLFAEGQNVAALTGDPAWAGQMGAFLAAGGHGVAFNAALQNNPVVKNQRTDAARNAAVFSVDTTANAALVARKGDTVPGTGGAQIFRFDGLARSSSGAHALRVLLRPAPAASDEALLFVKDGSSQLIAQEGVTAVTGAATVAKFGHFHVTAADEVVFLATLKGGGVNAANDGALCRWTEAGGIELLAREGAPAPGLGANFAVLQAVSVSPGGAVLLQTTLSGGRVALLRDTGAGMEKVTATGDSILVDGTPRVILSLSMHRDGVNLGGGGGGMGAAINDAGAVLSILSLGDGVHVARLWP